MGWRRVASSTAEVFEVKSGLLVAAYHFHWSWMMPESCSAPKYSTESILPESCPWLCCIQLGQKIVPTNGSMCWDIYQWFVHQDAEKPAAELHWSFLFSINLAPLKKVKLRSCTYRPVFSRHPGLRWGSSTFLTVIWRFWYQISMAKAAAS